MTRKQDYKKDLEHKINDKPSFGINKDMLGKLAYMTLEEIYYGINNFNVPALYQYMNPTEILGLHAAIYKKYDDYENILGTISLDAVLSKSVSFGYKSSRHFRNEKDKALYEIVHLLEKKNQNIFSITPGALNSRMKSLGTRLQKKIIKELEKSRNTQIPDPNIDGHSKNLYADWILKYYENAYHTVYNS